MAITFTVSDTVSWSNGNCREMVGSLATSGTYTGSGGDSLTPSAFGFSVIHDLRVSPKDGYTYDWNKSAQKLVIYAAGGVASHAHDLLIKGGQAASTTNNTAHYATDILGKEAPTDATIAGSASATKGGVMASTAITTGAAAEIANGTTLTLSSIRFRALGY